MKKTSIAETAPSDYVASLIKSNISGEHTPLGGIASFVGAICESSKNKVALDSTSHDVNVPLAMSGFGSDKPKISLEFQSLENKDSLHIGSEMNKTMFNIDDEDTSSYHIDAKKAPIPSVGTWNLNISSDIMGMKTPVKASVSGMYDITDSINRNKLIENDDGILIESPIYSPQITDNCENSNLPKSTLQMHFSRNEDGFMLNHARICCNYDGSYDQPNIACCPFKRNTCRDKRSIFSRFFCPTPCAEPCEQSQLAGFNEEMSVYIKDLCKYNPEISVAVSNDQSTLYGYNQDKIYACGEATQSLTSATLLHLLKKQGYDWNRVKKSSKFIYKTLGDCPLTRSIQKVYSGCNSDGSYYFKSHSGLTLIHLLTHTSGLPENLSVDIDAVKEIYDEIPQIKFKADENEFAQVLQDTKLVYRPGARVYRSNLNYAIIGAIISRLNVESGCQKSVCDTGYNLGMRNIRFADQDNSCGKPQYFMAPANGAYCSVGDLNSMLKTYHNKTEIISGMKHTITPQYKHDDYSTVYAGMGWDAARVLDKAQENVLYTTVDSSGYRGDVGQGVRATLIPEYGLNISVGMGNCHGSHYSKTCSKIVDKVVCLYTKYIKRQCPIVQVNQCSQLASLPPLYSVSSACLKESCNCHCEYASPCSKCQKNPLSFSFAAHLSLGGVKKCQKAYYACNDGPTMPIDTCTQVLETLCENKVTMLPLLPFVKVSDKVYVKKSTPEYTAEHGTKYYVQFGQNEEDDTTFCADLVRDRLGGTYRMVEGDGTPSEYVKIHLSKTDNGNPIFGISILGANYFNDIYVLSRQEKLKMYHKQISSQIKGKYNLSTNEEPIGARYVLPALAAGATLGGLAALSVAGRNRRYNDGCYVDYDGIYRCPYDVGYVPPIYGVGAAGRYPYGYYNTYNAFLPGRRRFAPRRRYRRRPAGGRRGGRRVNRRVNRRSNRSRRRSSRVNNSIENHKNFIQEQEAF